MEKIKLVIEGTTDTDGLVEALRNLIDTIDIAGINREEYVEGDLVINLFVS